MLALAEKSLVGKQKEDAVAEVELELEVEADSGGCFSVPPYRLKF